MRARPLNHEQQFMPMSSNDKDEYSCFERVGGNKCLHLSDCALKIGRGHTCSSMTNWKIPLLGPPRFVQNDGNNHSSSPKPQLWIAVQSCMPVGWFSHGSITANSSWSHIHFRFTCNRVFCTITIPEICLHSLCVQNTFSAFIPTSERTDSRSRNSQQ